MKKRTKNAAVVHRDYQLLELPPHILIKIGRYLHPNIWPLASTCKLLNALLGLGSEERCLYDCLYRVDITKRLTAMTGYLHRSMILNEDCFITRELVKKSVGLPFAGPALYYATGHHTVVIASLLLLNGYFSFGTPQSGCYLNRISNAAAQEGHLVNINATMYVGWMVPLLIMKPLHMAITCRTLYFAPVKHVTIRFHYYHAAFPDTKLDFACVFSGGAEWHPDCTVVFSCPAPGAISKDCMDALHEKYLVHVLRYIKTCKIEHLRELHPFLMRLLREVLELTPR